MKSHISSQYLASLGFGTRYQIIEKMKCSKCKQQIVILVCVSSYGKNWYNCFPGLFVLHPWTLLECCCFDDIHLLPHIEFNYFFQNMISRFEYLICPISTSSKARQSLFIRLWYDKPVFIRHRTEDDIKLNNIDLGSLRDPQEDSARVKDPEWARGGWGMYPSWLHPFA